MPTLNPQQFVPSTQQWLYRGAPEDINKAIDSYAHRIPDTAVQGPAPYNAESLAEIYEPRVRQLMSMQSRGATHAAWGRLHAEEGQRWHPVNPDTPEIKNPLRGPEHAARKEAARLSGPLLS